MRPEWLGCGTCLWVDGGCNKPSKNPSGRNLLEVCSEWTCARCWEEWDMKEYADGPLDDERSWYVDHSCCPPAQVGKP
jgi:hypothetical protein